jgi:hypothetical protein
MKSFVSLTLLSGLLVAGCASDNSNFSAAPGPSAGATVAVPDENHPAPAPQPPQVASSQPKQTQPAPKPAPSVVTPDNSIAGKVMTYNSVGRFVVLRFPTGQMPRDGQALFVYRGGLKVGELKISGEQRDNFVVADVVNGEAQAGDDARDQ